jgi:beta-glucanase (GH16 family)
MRKSLRLIATLCFVLISTMSTPAAATVAIGVDVAANVNLSASASTGCGGTYAKPGGGFYQCTMADNFSGTSLNTSLWTVQTTAASGFHSGPECFVDSPNNIRLSGGYLNLTVRREAAPFVCSSPSGNYVTQYTSGMVMTWNKFSQAYGRFEIRAKFPAVTVAGLQESLWMVPQTPRYGPWPWSGEIDVAESYSANAQYAVPYFHYVSTTDASPTKACRISVGAFHKYVLQWTPDALQVSIDGVTCINDNFQPAPPLVKPQPFDQPFVLALTQALGVGTNAPSVATPLPATTQVDYVKVWS